MDPLTIGLGVAGAGALFNGIGAWMGGNSAADAQRASANAQLQGMREAIAAQQNAYGQQRADLMPFRQFGLETMGQYRDMAMNPNLDSIRRERQDATNDLNAQLAGMGMHNSGFAGRQHALLQSDYASRMYQARLGALQPLLGVGQNAAGQLANAAGQNGQGLAGSYQSGYGAYGNALGQAGMYSGMATSGLMGGLGNGLSGLGLAGYGAYSSGSLPQGLGRSAMENNL